MENSWRNIVTLYVVSHLSGVPLEDPLEGLVLDAGGDDAPEPVLGVVGGLAPRGGGPEGGLLREGELDPVGKGFF